MFYSSYKILSDYVVGGEPNELDYCPKVDQIFQELSMQSNTLFPTPNKGEGSKQGIITPLNHEEVEKDSEVLL